MSVAASSKKALIVASNTPSIKMSELVGLPGIEPGLHAPEACVIPLYHSPLHNL